MIIPWKWYEFVYEIGLATSKGDARRAIKGREIRVGQIPFDPKTGKCKTTFVEDPEAMADVSYEDIIFRGKPLVENPMQREIIFRIGSRRITRDKWEDLRCYCKNCRSIRAFG